MTMQVAGQLLDAKGLNCPLPVGNRQGEPGGCSETGRLLQETSS